MSVDKLMSKYSDSLNTKNRLDYLDLCKAIAVLLVIFYHSITLLPISIERTNIISALIEPFHVSVFYVISGVLFVNSLKKGNGWKKCKTYFIKYFLLTLCWGIIQGLYIFLITKNDFFSCIIHGFYNYWFFPVLVLGYFFLFFIYKSNLKWFVVFPVWLLVFFLSRNSSMLMRIMFFPFLMYIGTIFRELKLSVIIKLLICCLAYAVVSSILIYFGYDSTYNGKTGFMGMTGFLNLLPGSMILPLLLEFINSKKKIKLLRIISFIGQNTLLIYILHYFIKLPLIDFSRNIGWLYFIFSYFSILMGTILFIFLYRKFKAFMIELW